MTAHFDLPRVIVSLVKLSSCRFVHVTAPGLSGRRFVEVGVDGRIVLGYGDHALEGSGAGLAAPPETDLTS